jgi:hypothetical protein
MRLGSEMDPALQAATLALSRRAQHQASRFASIELRSSKAKQARTGRLAPLGYAMATTFGLALVLAAWFF